MYKIFLAIVLPIILAIVLYTRTGSPEPEPINLLQDEIYSSSSSQEETTLISHDEYYGDANSTLLEELDSPVAIPAWGSSAAFNQPYTPHARFIPHHPVSHSSSSSWKSSSSSYSASSYSSDSSSISDFCTSDRYLERYKTQAEKEAAMRFRNKICR